MATIIRQGVTGDGYDVTILTGGQSVTLHFLQQPAADVLQDTIDSFEQNLVGQRIETGQLDDLPNPEEEFDDGSV